MKNHSIVIDYSRRSLNHFLWALLLCLLFISIPCRGQPTILVLGDSLSAAYQIPPESGWVQLLENKLRDPFPQAIVINSSIPGDTTSNGLNRLPDLLTKYHPNIVLLELGANDGLRGLPIQTIKSNLSRLIDLSLKANAQVLLIGIKLPPNYGGIYAQQFYDNFLQLSKEHSIPLVPFLLDKVVLKPHLMQADRLHPTAEAQPHLLDNVWPYLEPLLSRAATP